MQASLEPTQLVFDVYHYYNMHAREKNSLHSKWINTGIMLGHREAGAAARKRVGAPRPQARQCAAAPGTTLLDPHGLWLRSPSW